LTCLIKLDPHAYFVAVGGYSVIGFIEVVRFKDLELQRHRKPAAGAFWAEPDENLSGFNNLPGNERLESVEIKQTVRVRFLGPVRPELLQRFFEFGIGKLPPGGYPHSDDVGHQAIKGSGYLRIITRQLA
jgi:hypothetical protein